MKGNLQDAINYARANPNSDFANALKEKIQSGGADEEAKQLGVDLSWAGRPPLQQDTETDSQPFVGGLVGDIAGKLQKRGENIMQAGEEARQDVAKAGGGAAATAAGFGQTIGRTAGQVAGGAMDIIGEGLKKGLDIVAPGGSEGVAERFKQQTEDFKGQQNAFGETNDETLSKIHDAIQKIPLPDNVKKGFGDLFSTLGLTGLGRVADMPVENIPATVSNLAEKGVNQAKKLLSTASGFTSKTAPIVSDETKSYLSKVATGGILPEGVKEKVATFTAEPQLKTSAQRLQEQAPLGGVGAARQKQLVEVYDDFATQEQKHLADIKQDPAISMVGERIGDAFDSVVRQRREVGKTLQNELKNVSGVNVDTGDVIRQFDDDLSANGLSREEGKLSAGDESKVNEADRTLLEKYDTEISKLGDNPTIGKLDAMISRVSSDLDLYKSKNGIVGTTNGERIIKKNLSSMRALIDAEQSGNKALSGYSQAKKAYAELTNFLEEGQRFMGKKTQSGDYAKDASVAKSAVQSVLNNGKKDWLIELENLTGYPALDESVLALQAMKDAGDFKGQSLLDLLSKDVKAGDIPTSKTGAIMKLLGIGKNAVARAVVGTPAEQTRSYLRAIGKGEDVPKKIEGGVPNTQSRNSDEYKNFPRQNGLSAEDKAIEDASIEKYLSNKEGVLTDYKKEFGKVANADLARRLFRDVGYNGQNSAAVQEAASALAKDAWRDALANNKQPNAFLYAGGSGSGKSSVVDEFLPNLEDEAAAVLDGNLSNISSAQARIKEALDAGKTPNIVYIYRDPIDAWVNGVVKRMNTNEAEGGRIVPMSAFLDNHPGSLNTVKKLIDSNQGIEFYLFDNSLGTGNAQQMPLDKLYRISYNKDELKMRLLAETKRLLQEKIITKEQYEKLIK